MKARHDDYLGRFREVISDPLNILIKRDPLSGMIDKEGYVCLHNGNKVPISGENSYYGNFSQILVMNRGVHEPLEEFCFQETLEKIMDVEPKMIELGSYWAHYSMWFMKKFPKANCFMVEPDKKALDAGYNNFRNNNFLNGKFYLSKVAKDAFILDEFVNLKKINKISILHSDIQGSELEMLNGAKNFLSKKSSDYIFLSTHSQNIHNEAKNKLESFGYIIEVSSDFDNHTTSCDGFILATSPLAKRVFKTFLPFGRGEISSKKPNEMIEYLKSIIE